MTRRLLAGVERTTRRGCAAARPGRPAPRARVVRQRRRHRRQGPGPDQLPRRPGRHQGLRPAARAARAATPTSTPPTRAATWPCCACSTRRRPPLTAATLGDGGDGPQRGQFVLSPGQPVRRRLPRRQPSASWGIVSNLRRRAPASAARGRRSAKPLHHYGTLLQTDARLHLGCSGGALLNLQRRAGRPDDRPGRPCTAARPPAASPSRSTPACRRIVDVLKRGEEVEYGFLGVSFDRAPAADGGVGAHRIVTAGSPADAGQAARASDVILRRSTARRSATTTTCSWPSARTWPARKVRLERPPPGHGAATVERDAGQVLRRRARRSPRRPAAGRRPRPARRLHQRAGPASRQLPGSASRPACSSARCEPGSRGRRGPAQAGRGHHPRQRPAGRPTPGRTFYQAVRRHGSSARASSVTLTRRPTRRAEATAARSP